MATPTAKPATKTTVTATADVDPSKLQKITNNSGTDIVIGTTLGSTETDNSHPVISYNKDFLILTASGGGTTIKDGITDTVTLDRTVISGKTGKPVYQIGYELLVSTAGWLSPVANLGIMQDEDDNDPPKYFYDPVTIGPDARTAMQQTADFYQTIAAYPDSQLAKDYVAAMNNIDPGSGSVDQVNAAISKGVEAFFQSTKSYQKVTLPNLVMLEAYYNFFPFAWAGYTDAVTYFLYSSDGTNTSFMGAFSMTKTGSVDITKLNGGYTCSFAPAVTPSDTSTTKVDASKAKALSFSDGLFVDDLTSDEPGIALKGSFQLKRTFTKDPNDTKIMVVVCGTINGQTAVGFDQTQCTNKDDTTEDWLDSLFHPKTAAQIFNSIMTILGALMMLHFVATTLYGISKWVKNKAAAKEPGKKPGEEPVEEEDLAAEKTRAQAEWEAKQAANLNKVSGKKETLPDTPEDGLSKATTEKGTLSDCVSAGQTESGLVKMKDNLKSLEQYVEEDYGGTMQGRINDSAMDVRNAYNEIRTAEIADLKTTLAELRPQLTELSAKITQLNTDIQNIVQQQQKADMADNVKEMETVQDAVEKESKTAEDESRDAKDGDPKADSEDFPEGLDG